MHNFPPNKNNKRSPTGCLQEGKLSLSSKLSWTKWTTKIWFEIKINKKDNLKIILKMIRHFKINSTIIILKIAIIIKMTMGLQNHFYQLKLLPLYWKAAKEIFKLKIINKMKSHREISRNLLLIRCLPHFLIKYPQSRMWKIT
jgi:hypothetical protein